MGDKSKTIIGLVGETGSGKDTVANHIHKKYNIELLRFADPLKKMLRMVVDQPSKEDHNWLYGNLKDRFGEEVLHDALQKRVNESDQQFLCVNGLRMPKDLDFVRSFESNCIIYVTADQKLRWQRNVSRNEKADDDQTFEKFVEFETTAQTEKAVPGIGATAQYRIDNDGTLEELLARTDAVMDEIVKK